jgi:hypothetical protein
MAAAIFEMFIDFLLIDALRKRAAPKIGPTVGRKRHEVAVQENEQPHDASALADGGHSRHQPAAAWHVPTQ